MAASPDGRDGPVTLWATFGRNGKKAPVIIDGEICKDKAAEVHILKDGCPLDIQEKDVAYMYAATICWCCGRRDRELLCPADTAEEGTTQFYNSYATLKAVEAGQDVRRMSRLEVMCRDGNLLSVGMGCESEESALYFRAVASAVKEKLALISCRKTSEKAHRRGMDPSAPAPDEAAEAEAELDAQAEADRHMQELLASESHACKPASENHDGKPSRKRRCKRAKPSKAAPSSVPEASPDCFVDLPDETPQLLVSQEQTTSPGEATDSTAVPEMSSSEKECQNSTAEAPERATDSADANSDSDSFTVVQKRKSKGVRLEPKARPSSLNCQPSGVEQCAQADGVGIDSRGWGDGKTEDPGIFSAGMTNSSPHGTWSCNDMSQWSCSGHCGFVPGACSYAIPDACTECPTEPPPPPETQDRVGQAMAMEIHQEGHVDQSILRPPPPETKDGVAQCMGLELHEQEHEEQSILRQELDQVKQALNQSMARQAEQSQLVALLQHELRLAKCMPSRSEPLMVQTPALGSWDQLNGFKAEDSLLRPPGLESASLYEPMKVHMISSKYSPMTVTPIENYNGLPWGKALSHEDDSSVASTVCCADQDNCSQCDFNIPPVNLADYVSDDWTQAGLVSWPRQSNAFVY